MLVYWGSGMEKAGKPQLNCFARVTCFVCWWSVVGWFLLTNVELWCVLPLWAIGGVGVWAPVVALGAPELV